MAPFSSLMQKSRLRQTGNQVDPAKQEAEFQSQAAQCSLQTELQVPPTSHTTPTPQTYLNYVEAKWMDNSILADVADDSDIRRSPDGPSRIHDNFVVREIDTDWSSTQQSVYYMKTGRFKHNEDHHDIAGAPDTPALEGSRRYNPAYRHGSEADWRARATRNLRDMRGTGSLTNLNANHLRDRHYFESRVHDPWEALGAASQQAQIELRALKLESDALTLSSTRTTREATTMEGETESLAMDILALEAKIEEMTERIENRSLAQQETSNVPGT